MLATWGCTTFPKPTLSLDFLGATSLDSGITFSRGSQATLFDSTGTLVFAKHNLALQSADFSTTWVTASSAVSTNTVIAPDGTLTADTLTASAATAAHELYQTIGTSVSGFRYTMSLYAKAGTNNFVQLFFGTVGFGSTAFANFDLSNGTLGTVGATATASITPVGDGWYRCAVTATATAAASYFHDISLIPSSTATRNQSWTAAGTENIYIWGAQLNIANMEGGVTSSLTTYYPTTTAAYYAPRFDYNPSTLQPRGLLIEEQRTNLETYSDDFSNAYWNKNNATVSSNVIIAPDGNLTGDKLITDSGLTNGQVFGTATLAASTTYTFSCFAKAGEWSWTNLATRGPENIDIGAWFNLSAGTVGTVSAGVTASITPVGNGWYRCAVTRTTGTGAATSRQRIHSTNADNAYSTGDGTSGIYIWGAQLEVGAFATSYIPTTTTALTRNADVASMTGTNFSSWYNASEGTLFAQYQPSVTGVNLGAVAISDGTNSNRMIIRGMTTTSVTAFIGVSSGSTQWNDGFATATATSTKSIFAYATNNIAFSRNGVTPVTDTVATIPTVNQLRIGADGDGTLLLNGYIQRLSFYPTRLPNATLQALTA